MNVTSSPLEASITIADYYPVGSLSAIISSIAVGVSIFILILVRKTKPRLHTVRHLLMCNTSVASILYCIIQTVNYIFLIFIRWETSDVGCRWRGYFAYLSITAVTYSFLVQAVSRFFISILSHRYRWLTTFKTHYILILIQWVAVIILPLPAILTKDIYYRPTSLCWVPLRFYIHIAYTFFVYYIVPILFISIIYALIYYRVKQATNHAGMLVRTTNSSKRDVELLRNILILLGIYLLGGIPSVLFLITANKLIYLMGIASISLAVAVEKVCTIFLDHEIRLVVKTLIHPRTAVMPFDQSTAARRGY